MIDTYADNPEDDPFFMMVSFPDPHHPFTPPGKYWDMYNPDQVELPSSFHMDTQNTPGAVTQARQILKDYGMDPAKTMVILPANERETREAIALTCGMITMIDDAVADILRKLEERGLAEDTVILFTADHGDLLGDYGLLLKARFTLSLSSGSRLYLLIPIQKGFRYAMPSVAQSIFRQRF